jgi:pimeloyl-ACP methyl ester carboxylesterase
MPENTPLVLLHGYPFDHTVWQQVLRQLPGDLPIVAPDLPGFGREPVAAGEPSIDILAEFIQQLLVRRNVDKAIVAGFSMGGYVALGLLEKYPERVAALALINSQPFADSDEVRAGRRTMIERVRREGAEAAAKAALLKLFAPGKASDPTLSGYAQRGAQAAGVAGITWALEAMARRPDRAAILQTMQAPLLIVHSAQDQFIPVERIREFARNHPAATYVEVPESGHCTPLENPEAIARALTQFVSGK